MLLIQDLLGSEQAGRQRSFIKYTILEIIYNTMQLKSVAALVGISWGLKLLLIPAYYSTDFAVHQNWLRITHNYPLGQWYHNEDSKWTLDYPPLFAYFEYLLALLASCLSPHITADINQSVGTVYYQRISVIVSDLVYLLSILYFAPKRTSPFLMTITYLSPCFIVLDNIHFQYNALLQAFLVTSVGLMLRKQYLLSAFTYATLLNFKHIYLYCAPAFFIYLLREYVLAKEQKEGQVLRFLKLGVVTILPFLVSFGPFLVIGGLEEVQQILGRLFPFGRGLVHEYWAPNFWALYMFLDKVAFLLITKVFNKNLQQISLRLSSENTNTTLKVLPSAPPLFTVLIILVCLLPILYRFFFRSQKQKQSKQSNQTVVQESQFPLLVCLSGLIFFLFGFHVHEKAITPYISILMLFCPGIKFVGLAAFVNLVNLLPLLITPAEKVLSIVLCFFWLEVSNVMGANKLNRTSEHSFEKNNIQQLKKSTSTAISNSSRRHLSGWAAVSSSPIEKVFPMVSSIAQHISLSEIIEYLVVLGGMGILFYHHLIHPLIRKNNIEFLPLMLNSLWAALFNIVWTGNLYFQFLRGNHFKETDHQGSNDIH